MTVIATYLVINAICAIIYLGLEKGHYWQRNEVNEFRRKYAEQIQAVRYSLMVFAPFELFAHLYLLRRQGIKPFWMNPFKTV